MHRLRAVVRSARREGPSALQPEVHSGGRRCMMDDITPIVSVSSNPRRNPRRYPRRHPQHSSPGQSIQQDRYRPRYTIVLMPLFHPAHTAMHPQCVPSASPAHSQQRPARPMCTARGTTHSLTPGPGSVVQNATLCLSTETSPLHSPCPGQPWPCSLSQVSSFDAQVASVSQLPFIRCF